MMRATIHVLLVGLVLTGAGCFEEMDPGKDCGSCHAGRIARRFGASGTVYFGPTAGARDGAEGVTIDITDSAGTKVSLESNGVGNFSTRTPLVPPLQVTISRGGVSRTMADAPSGNCNSCHAAPPARGPGRVYLPAAEGE